MDVNIFTDASKKPKEADLKVSLENLFPLWKDLRNYVFGKYPSAIEEWNFPGAKYGWSFRIKDKKRAILYFLPRDKYFKVALVFGQKAMDDILSSNISEAIKNELKSARVYAEGRGIRIDIKDISNIDDIKKMIDIKIAH